MMWLIYNLLFVFGFLVMLPRFLWRMARRGGYARNFLERFGRYAPAVRAQLAAGGRVWVHAVSVGEVGVGLRLIAELRRRQPDLRCVLSTTTSTGHAVAQRQLAAADVLIYFPLDFPLLSRRVLNLIRPRALLLIENELWPNLVRGAGRRGIPVVMVNGRISPHSYAGYRRLKPWTRRLLAGVNLCCAQGAADAQRLRDLGAPADRVRVLGSAKYDLAPAGDGGASQARAALRAAGFADERPLLLGGSTWPGEEAALLDAWRAVRDGCPDLALVLVPRHAERRAAVLEEINRRGLRAVLRSDPPAPAAAARPDVLLVDTTGELRNFYAVADVIFVGKSLTRHGGQNIIEPAQCAKPVIVGPHMENFDSILPDFLAAQAVIQVPDAAALTRAIRQLLADPDARRALGARAAEVVHRKAGAIRATVDLVLPLLNAADERRSP